jgi:hypothetical protein
MKHAMNAQILHIENMGKYLLDGGYFLYLAREEFRRVVLVLSGDLATTLSRQDHPQAIVCPLLCHQ